ncbi:hypothetical protein ABKV19_000630 [Rosa sericea]
MLMVKESSNWSAAGGFAAEDFDGEDMSIDLDTFYHLLEEEPPVVGKRCKNLDFNHVVLHWILRKANAQV